VFETANLGAEIPEHYRQSSLCGFGSGFHADAYSNLTSSYMEVH
jgi:hypothetical protein